MFADFLVFIGIVIAWLTLMGILVKNLLKSAKMQKVPEMMLTFIIIVFLFIATRFVNTWLLQCSFHQEFEEYVCGGILLSR